jgi:hypothetical protein
VPIGDCPSRTVSFAAQRVAVERGRLRRRVRVHRLALDELALDRIERCELVVTRFERPDLIVDAEQRGQEVLEMRCERDQEVGFALLVERCRIGPRTGESCRERCVCRFERRDE